MSRKRNIAVAIAISAAAGFLALQNVSAPTPDSAAQTPATVELLVTEPPVTEASVPNQCAFVWAYHDAPELTENLDAAVKAINPAASGRAQLFGEDCVYADGHSTFGAMETDFYIYLTVDDLENKEHFGNWMEQVLPLITQIPQNDIQGKYGFVEFWFERADQEMMVARVPIQEYLDKGQGKTGAELLQMFSGQP